MRILTIIDATKEQLMMDANKSLLKQVTICILKNRTKYILPDIKDDLANSNSIWQDWAYLINQLADIIVLDEEIIPWGVRSKGTPNEP